MVARKIRRNSFCGVVCGCCLLILETGCIVTRHVSNHEGLLGGYRRGDTYETCVDVAMTEFGVLSALPAKIVHNREAPEANAGIVDAGTRVVIVDVLYRKHPENGASISPQAAVESGPWKGRRVELQYLSRKIGQGGDGAYQFSILEPDSRYLKRITVVP